MGAHRPRAGPARRRRGLSVGAPGAGAGAAASWSAQVVHTADLDAPARRAARALCDAAFAGGPDGDFDDDDWDHCLGGLHVLVHDGADLVGHAAVVQRRVLLEGRALRTGYVEAVAVASTHRRRGVGGALMTEVERVVRAAYDLGALGASADGAALYGPRGWTVWRGPTSALTPGGTRRTPGDDGAVMVLAGEALLGAGLDPEADLMCDWRDGDLW